MAKWRYVLCTYIMVREFLLAMFQPLWLLPPYLHLLVSVGCLFIVLRNSVAFLTSVYGSILAYFLYTVCLEWLEGLSLLKCFGGYSGSELRDFLHLPPPWKGSSVVHQELGSPHGFSVGRVPLNLSQHQSGRFSLAHGNPLCGASTYSSLPPPWQKKIVHSTEADS